MNRWVMESGRFNGRVAAGSPGAPDRPVPPASSPQGQFPTQFFPRCSRGRAVPTRAGRSRVPARRPRPGSASDRAVRRRIGTRNAAGFQSRFNYVTRKYFRTRARRGPSRPRGDLGGSVREKGPRSNLRGTRGEFRVFRRVYRISLISLQPLALSEREIVGWNVHPGVLAPCRAMSLRGDRCVRNRIPAGGCPNVFVYVSLPLSPPSFFFISLLRPFCPRVIASELRNNRRVTSARFKEPRLISRSCCNLAIITIILHSLSQLLMIFTIKAATSYCGSMTRLIFTENLVDFYLVIVIAIFLSDFQAIDKWLRE